MAEPAFTPSFLRRIIEVEKAASGAELELLNQTLARIVTEPILPERFPTYYDLALPTFFVRAGPFLMEFAVNEATNGVTFISLFYRW